MFVHSSGAAKITLTSQFAALVARDFLRPHKSKHQKVCRAANAGGKMMMAPLVVIPTIPALEKLPEGFSDLLNSMHDDEVSAEIKKDRSLLMIGTRYRQSLSRKKDKIVETSKYVRGCLRLTARLWLSFKKRLEESSVMIDMIGPFGPFFLKISSFFGPSDFLGFGLSYL